MHQYLLLAIALLPSTPSLAQDDAQPAEQRISATVENGAAKPAPQLIRLDRSLTKAQDDKDNGRLDGKRYQEFVTKFRADLEDAMARVKPTPPNIALHARLISRLGDSKQALAALGTAIKQNPDSPELGAALSQVHYDQKDYPSALAAANAVLERDPTNREAVMLKHFSEGRIAHVSGDMAPPPSAAADFAHLDWTIPEKNDISPKALNLIHQGIAARRNGDVEAAWGPIQAAMNADPTSTSVQVIYGKMKADRAKYLETRSYLVNAADAIDAGHGDEALSWAQKAYERAPSADTKSVLEDVQRRSAALTARREAEGTPRAQMASGEHAPQPLAPLGKAGAAGAAAGLAAWLLWGRKSDNPNIRGPAMAFAMTGLGASGAGFAAGVYVLSQPRSATDVGMFHTNQAPLLQGAPNVAQAPGGRPDCADQLKKFYPQQQDAQQKRQGALVILQPILDKHGLSFEKFQSVFPKLVTSYVATCDADPAACALMANKDDWAAAQAAYGQIQVLDQKLQLLSGVLAKLMDKCKVPDNDVKDGAAKKVEGTPHRNGRIGKETSASEASDASVGKNFVGGSDTGDRELIQNSSKKEFFNHRGGIPNLERTLAELDKSGQLPENYIKKDQARALGWQPGVDLARIAPGKIIGGDVFRNEEGKLPSAVGRIWYEADLNYTAGPRGATRLLYSNDGLRYLSMDHYQTFERIPK